MKNLLTLLFLASSFFCLPTCRQKNHNKEAKQDSVNNITRYDSIEQVEIEEKERLKKRRAKGDTVAMPYKQLQQYLPRIDGYTSLGEPRGSQMNMPGIGSWSQAEQEYETAGKKLTVSIFDYNSAQQAFFGLTAVYGMGFSSEDASKKQAPVYFDIKGILAYETIYKNDKRGEIVLVAANRFIINIKSEGQGDEEFLKSTAQKIDLRELATL